MADNPKAVVNETAPGATTNVAAAPGVVNGPRKDVAPAIVTAPTPAPQRPDLAAKPIDHRTEALHAPVVRSVTQATVNDSVQPVPVRQPLTNDPDRAIDPATNRVNASIPTSPPSGRPLTRKLVSGQESVGQAVRYVLPNGSPFAGEVRAAIVTRVLGDGTANIALFKGESHDLDNTNVQALDGGGIFALLSGVREGAADEPGTFHAV